MVKPFDQGDVQTSPGLWDRDLDEGMPAKLLLSPSGEGSGISKAKAEAFSLAIFAFLVAWIVLFVYMSLVFGIGASVHLSMIPPLPLAVAIRMRHRWPFVRLREFVLLAILVTFAFGAVVFIVHDWYDKGMDVRHARELVYTGFIRELHRDPAFKEVKLEWGPKGGYWVAGTVASDADLDRLRSRAAEHHLDDWAVKDVTVADRSAPAED